VNPFAFLNNVKFGIREATAFVGHSFADDDQHIVQQLIKFLTKLGIKCETGLRPEPRGVSDKVNERIRAAELFVGIFTRRDKHESGSYSTSAWTIEEKATALAAGKKLLLFVEDGVNEFGGLQGDYEYVRFNRDSFGDALVHAMDYVLSVTTVPFELQVENGRVNIKLSSGQSPDEHLKALESKVQNNPNNVNARVTLANAYRSMKRTGDALREFGKLAAEFPNVSSILHEYGHAKEDAHDLPGALLCYQQALDLSPNDFKNHKCYGACLYRHAQTLAPVQKTSTLHKSKRLLERALAIGGEQQRASVEGTLFLISEALREIEEHE